MHLYGGCFSSAGQSLFVFVSISHFVLAAALPGFIDPDHRLYPRFNTSYLNTSSIALSSPSINFHSTRSLSTHSKSSTTRKETSSGLGSSSTRSLSSSHGTSTSIPHLGTGSSSSSALSNTTAQPLVIITSIIVQSSHTLREPVIIGGVSSSPITLPPITTTIASSQATSSVSSVSSQIAGLIPIINSWKRNPTPLKSETLGKLNGVKSDVEGLISNLGGQSSPSPCGSKKKRGLGGPLGIVTQGVKDIVNTLSCVSSELDNAEDDIKAGDINGIESTIGSLTSEIDNLSDETDDKQSNSDRQSDSATSASTPDSSSGSTSASSSSFCKSTNTALQVTVLCVPTSIISSGTTISTTTCSPFTTITASGCSVTGLTTTSIESSTTSRTFCATDTCGTACPMAPGPLSGASMGLVSTDDCALIPTITVSSVPTASDARIGNPTIATSSPGAVKRTVPEGSLGSSVLLVERTLPTIAPVDYRSYVAGLSGRATWVFQGYPTSGQWFDYPSSGTFASGVNGMYGCTGVIIASDKGVYIAHIWEIPVFTNEQYKASDDNTFTTLGFNALRDGSANAQSIKNLVGTDASPGPLHSSNAPQIYVITPKTTMQQKANGWTTQFIYQARVEKLASDIKGILPGSTQSILGYKKTDKEMSTRPNDYTGRAILEVDALQQYYTSYTDKKGVTRQIGAWRLWVEDRLITTPKGNYFFGPLVTGSAAKRRNDNLNQCGIPSKSSILSSSAISLSSYSYVSSSPTDTHTGNTTVMGSLPPTSKSLSNTSGNSTLTGTLSVSSKSTITSKSAGSTSQSAFTKVTSSTGPTTTSKATNSSPLITSCTLSSVTAFSSADSYYTNDYPATIACACNGGQMTAGIASTVGSDSSTTYVCQIESTHIAVSTAAPPPVKTTSTHITVSTAAPPPVKTTSTPHAPQTTAPTKEVFVYYDNYIDEISDKMYWTFFEGHEGNLQKSINLCDTKFASQVDAHGSGKDMKNPPWPHGSWDMKLFGQANCLYASDGKGAGTLKCPGMSEPKACLGGQDSKQLKCIGAWADYYREVARCLW